MTNRTPRCPSCGWSLIGRPYADVYNNPLEIWELVCSNPNEPTRNPACHMPVNTINGFRSVSPSQATYR
jgi:hypothetical protein